MTIRDLILLEIEKTKSELERLQKQLDRYNQENQDNRSVKVCTNCKTYNLHYNVKSDSFTCSFC